MPTSLADLRARLPELTHRDQLRLSRRADKAAALRDSAARERAFGRLSAELDEAAAVVEKRRESVPVISYPPELPISQKKDEIAAAIRDHQVVIVAGETGSGKTTQLPKICLELGRGVTGQIGHTQPRRIAARTVAARIAEELDTELGTTVGYKVRFNDNSSDETLVKLMTDGILLTEMQRDRRLLRYDTLIIDEAHERSLNIDFILGYLKRLLPSRPDLKVIITSATIDPQRFSKHFEEAESGGIRTGDRTGPASPGLRPGEWPVSRRSTAAGREAQRGDPGGRPPGQHWDPGGSSPRASTVRRWSRCPGGPIRSRCGTGRSPTRTAPTRSPAIRPRPSATPWTSCAPPGPATSWSSSAVSGRSGTPPMP